MKSFHVSCSKKRGSHRELPTQLYKPHERIEGLGGIHNRHHWYLSEALILEELQKSELARSSAFQLTINRHEVFVILAVHNGRMYLKTPLDDYAPDTLLALPECPVAKT